MAASLLPSATPLSTPNTYHKNWTPEAGERFTEEANGDEATMATLYTSWLGTAVQQGVGEVNLDVSNGRAKLIRAFGRGGQNPTGDDDKIEELYGVDVFKDIRTADLFGTLTDQNIVDITARYEDGKGPISTWTDLQKQLFTMLVHGEEVYPVTGFILRITQIGVRSKIVKASFTGINRVTSKAPGLSVKMRDLVQSLPAGEWLKKPPQVAYMDKGRWRVSQEYWYAEKWTVLVGGTLFA